MSLYDVLTWVSRATGIGWRHPPRLIDTSAYHALERQTDRLLCEAQAISAETKRLNNIEAWQFRRRVL